MVGGLVGLLRWWCAVYSLRVSRRCSCGRNVQALLLLLLLLLLMMMMMLE